MRSANLDTAAFVSRKAPAAGNATTEPTASASTLTVFEDWDRLLGRSLRAGWITVVAGIFASFCLPTRCRADEQSIPASKQVLTLPPRPAGASTGSELAQQWSVLSLAEREAAAMQEFLSGNVPEAWRQFCEVRSQQIVKGVRHELQFLVSPDYVAIGSTNDHLRIPLSPAAAQQLANRTDCILPSRRMVDLIYAAANCRLTPQPIPPTPEMTQVPTFLEHHRLIENQLVKLALSERDHGLLAGHKKDVVNSNKLKDRKNSVAIYGWHRSTESVIQPLYAGHIDTWVDYSHGVRLVSNKGALDGKPCRLSEILNDPNLSTLLSDEGTLALPMYGPTDGERDSRHVAADERVSTFHLPSTVRVYVSTPSHPNVSAGENTELIIYALPNGNTIEQTLGRTMNPGDDWHFDIQHIAAQTRFVRETWPDKRVVLVLLEADGLSWPAWRRKHSDSEIPGILADVARQSDLSLTNVTLAAHSGGGSLIFGLINSGDDVPDYVRRIVFLDATYGYLPETHSAKLNRWLQRPNTSMCVMAYRDIEVELNGKRIVSAAGGTWYRSQLMLSDLQKEFEFQRQSDGPIETVRSDSGRIEFRLHGNPENRILHTVQVERNGLIHGLLFNSNLSEKAYRYFGDRAYSGFVR
jgi:hypothetical protein